MNLAMRSETGIHVSSYGRQIITVSRAQDVHLTPRQAPAHTPGRCTARERLSAGSDVGT